MEAEIKGNGFSVGREKRRLDMGAIFEKAMVLSQLAAAYYDQADILKEIDMDISNALDSLEEGSPLDPSHLTTAFREIAKLPNELAELVLEELVPAHQALIEAKEKARRKGAA